MTKEQAREILVNATFSEEWQGNEDLTTAYHMAIKALEQQPCEDCVSREDAKKFLYEELDRLNNDELYDIFSKIIDDMYNELPSVTPAQSWIPIERRDLTQEEKELYSSLYGEEPEYMIESRMPDDGEEVLVSAGGIVFNDIFSHHDFDFEKISVDEIDAWMPLPQPYEEKGGNK